MIKNLLKKCLDELEKESPDLSYLKGILETLLEVESQPQGIVVQNTMTPKPSAPVNEKIEYPTGFDVLKRPDTNAGAGSDLADALKTRRTLQ